ncbi:ParB/RepB/Spo0J family partition protein [Candidatus Parcubacteria bacterium]|nr:MAG: ParB/RepB/Spo0J family partition protein [Candidatus Parcubacteria bacterium]
MLPEEEKLLTQGSIFLIEVEKIKPNSQQPRTEFDPEKLRDLSESIRQYGVLQPLVVTRRETESDKGITVEYELIAGERRLRASKLAGLSQVPVVIRKENDDRVKLELAIIENLQREDLNAIERAKAFKKLIENFKLKHHEVAARVGKSREYVTNSIRLLGLPEEVQNSLMRGEVSEGHCRVILSLDGKMEEMMTVYRDIVAKRMTVRQAERMSKNFINGRLMAQGVNIELKDMEKKLSDTLGTKVQIEMTGGRGTISIDFFSNEELNAFLGRMTTFNSEEGSVPALESQVKSIDGIIPNGALSLSEAVVAAPEKDPNGASDVDPVEELLKNFSV